MDAMFKIFLVFMVLGTGLAGCGGVKTAAVSSGKPEAMIPNSNIPVTGDEIIKQMSKRGYWVTGRMPNKITMAKPTESQVTAFPYSQAYRTESQMRVTFDLAESARGVQVKG